MRVLSFSSCFPGGGDRVTGVFVLKRLCALAKYIDLEVTHPVPWFPGLRKKASQAPRNSEQIEGLTVHHPRFFYIPRVLKDMDPRFYAVGLARWFRRHIADSGRPDLLDAHFAWPDGVGVSHLARLERLPFTITLRGTSNSRGYKPSMRPQIARALRQADAIISVSAHMAEIAVELGADADKVSVIPNGVDTSLFMPVSRDQARHVLGLPTEVPCLVIVASLDRNKGHDDVIEAMGRLPSDVHLVIVGGAGTGRGYRRRLSAIIGAKNLSSRVVFAGSCPQEKVATYFNAADISVLASHAEGCPNVVLESLACGTPVVATSVGAIPDLLRPGVNGLMVRPQDPGALAEALATALATSWSRDAIRQSVAGRSWDVVAREVLSVFERMLTGRSRAG